MSKTKTPKHRIEMSCVHFINKRREVHSFAFTGKVSDQAAKRFRDSMNESIERGSNVHLKGTQSNYSNAFIIEQRTGDVVAQYVAPAFESI